LDCNIAELVAITLWVARCSLPQIAASSTNKQVSSTIPPTRSVANYALSTKNYELMHREPSR
ncbi:MAG: hypothetical protein M0R32_06880, partial [Candidatus Cloacimonetes bacterium]|nr:hypothetical protein [Candidatus Cloacimonadota bacterium]